LEKGTILGLIFAIFALVITVLLQVSFDFGQALFILDLASIILVLGGAMASTIISAPFSQFIRAMKAMKIVFSPPQLDPAEAINQIVGLANTARKEGVLALEDSVASMDDEFLKKGIMLIVDGTDPELVKNIMETELAYIDERHADVVSVYEAIGTFAPSWGMKGTLIALILMLRDLDDLGAVGPNMAMAMITTLYGAIVANVWALPFAAKLRQISKEEMLLKTVLIEGMLSIQAGENPRIIEEKLKSFLSPMLRNDKTEAAAAAD
jgi:chemotaxis protein MotA